MEFNEERDKRSMTSDTSDGTNQISMAGVVFNSVDGPRVVGMHKFRQVHEGVDCLIFTYNEKGESKGATGLCYVEQDSWIEIDKADDQFKWYKSLLDSGWTDPNVYKAKGRIALENVQIAEKQTKCVWICVGGTSDSAVKEQESRVRRWPAAKDYRYFLFIQRNGGGKSMNYYRRPCEAEHQYNMLTFVGQNYTPKKLASGKKTVTDKKISGAKKQPKAKTPGGRPALPDTVRRDPKTAKQSDKANEAATGGLFGASPESTRNAGDEIDHDDLLPPETPEFDCRSPIPNPNRGRAKTRSDSAGSSGAAAGILGGKDTKGSTMYKDKDKDKDKKTVDNDKKDDEAEQLKTQLAELSRKLQQSETEKRLAQLEAKLKAAEQANRFASNCT